MRFDVAVLGDINADLILYGDVAPQFGQVEQLLDDAKLVIGGSAAIFACAAARLGLKTTLIGKVGRDLFGRFMLDALKAKGVDISGVVVNPKIRTGLTVILAQPQDRAILTYSGTISALTYPEIDFSLIAASRHLHLASFFLLDNLRPDIPKLFQAARKAGLSISMDTNYDPARKWDGDLQEAIRHIDILLPNETEASAITGGEDLSQAIEILSQTVPVLAVKQGAKGAVAKHGSGKIIRQAPPPVTVVDTVGAGDSFDAGFVYGYLQGWELTKTLQLAVCCGALSTRKAGGTGAQPHLEEAAGVIQQMDG